MNAPLTGLARKFAQDQIIDEEIAAKAQASTTPDVSKKVMAQFNASLNNLNMPELPGTKQTTPTIPAKATSMAMIEGLAPPVAFVDKSLRKATVPGQFHKTEDPFGADGMYGGARINAVDVNQISKPVHTIRNDHS